MANFSEIHPLLNGFDDTPFSKFNGLTLQEVGNGKATSTMQVTKNLVNPSGRFHAGFLYGASDVTAYAALLSVLEPKKAAATVDIQTSILRSASLNDLITLKAEVIKFGRTLAFLETRSYVNDRVIASTKITKAIL